MKILVIGNTSSGKSTFTNYIIKNKDFKEYALGDKLKEITFKILRLFNKDISSINELYNVNTKNKYRKFLQIIGTEICRDSLGEDIWCEILYKKINQSDNIIISDIRFLNELNFFKTKFNDCITIKIIRDNISNEYLSHRSECEINKIETDYIIENNSSIEDFYKKIDELTNFLKI